MIRRESSIRRNIDWVTVSIVLLLMFIGWINEYHKRNFEHRAFRLARLEREKREAADVDCHLFCHRFFYHQHRK